MESFEAASAEDGNVVAKRARTDNTIADNLGPYTFMVSEEEKWLAHFDEHGFCILRGVLDEQALASAQNGCCKLVDSIAAKLVAKGIVSDELKDRPFSKRLWELCKDCLEEMPLLIRPELHEPEFFPLLCNPKLIHTVRKIIKAPALRIFPNYSCRPKSPSKQHDVVWHQDAGLRSDGKPNTAPIDERMDAFGLSACVNVWTPLVPATVENGAMKFIPGSHQEGILPHEVAGSYGELTGLDLPREKFGVYATCVKPSIMERLAPRAVDIECAAGDVVLFNQFLVHRGGTNTSDHVRWSFDWRFQDSSKPTLRELNGHIVYSEDDTTQQVTSASEWGKLTLV